MHKFESPPDYTSTLLLSDKQREKKTYLTSVDSSYKSTEI